MRNPFRVARRWLRVTLPWDGVLLALIVLTVGAKTVSVLLPDGNVRRMAGDIGVGLAELLCFLGAFVYGVMRVVYSHPLLRSEYRKWLQLSPWDASRPLPDGPVTLQLQDAVIVAVLILLGATLAPAVSWTVIPALFLCGYLLALAIVISNTGQMRIAYWMVMLAGACIHWHAIPWLVGLCLLAIVILSQWGSVRSLRQFDDWDLSHWEGSGWEKLFSGQSVDLRTWAANRELGWPVDRLSPQRSRHSISTLRSVAVAGLTAWLSFVLASVLTGNREPAERQQLEVAVTALSQLMLPLVIFRLVRYLWGYPPPLSVWGRICTGRLIIPKYDYVLIAPLTVFLIWLGHVWVVRNTDWDVNVTAPLCLGLMLLAALGMPPTLDQWRLTGRHRVVPGLGMRTNEFQQGA